MAKKVDHEQRKREIAEKAIRLFSQVGYDNVSLIMIAAAAGISRTVLYRGKSFEAADGVAWRNVEDYLESLCR